MSTNMAEDKLQLDAMEYAKTARPSTETNFIIELFAGFLGATVICLVVIPLKDAGNPFGYIYRLVRDRGPIQFFELFMFWMVLAHIFMKLRIVKAQISVIAEGVVGSDIDLTDDHQIFSLRKRVRENAKFSWSILLSRVDRAIALWLGTKDVHRVATWAEAESERDSMTSDASFSTASLLIGSIPILGFIGTVLGLGTAVSGFAEFLKKGQMGGLEMEQITESLIEVTQGLGTAFDTTLLALSLSIIAQFPLVAVQRREENFLIEVENYVDDNLLSQFPADDSEPVYIEAIEDAIDAAFRRYVPDPDRYDEVFTRAIERAAGVVEERFGILANSYEASLQDLTKRLGASLTTVGDGMENSMRQIIGEIHAQDETMIASRRRIGDDEGERMKALLSDLQVNAEGIANRYRESAESLQRTTEEVSEKSLGAARDLSTRMEDIARLAAGIEDLLRVEQSIQKGLEGISASDEFRETLSELRTHLERTDAFCTQLNKRKVITLREEV